MKNNAPDQSATRVGVRVQRLVRLCVSFFRWHEMPQTRHRLADGIVYRVVEHGLFKGWYRVQRFAGQRWRVVSRHRVEIYEHLRYGPHA